MTSDNSLYAMLQNLKAYRKDRLEAAYVVIQNPDGMEELLGYCTEVNDPISYKAAWVLEMVFLENPATFYPYIDYFFQILPQLTHVSAIRPFGKIGSILCETFYQSENHPIHKLLKISHRKQLVETCFDWLISNQKTAAKAYAMQSLFELGKEFEWIHPELQQIIQNNYELELPAYRARARMVLKSLKKIKK